MTYMWSNTTVNEASCGNGLARVASAIMILQHFLKQLTEHGLKISTKLLEPACNKKKEMNKL
jgi:hypothetical protein